MCGPEIPCARFGKWAAALALCLLWPASPGLARQADEDASDTAEATKAVIATGNSIHETEIANEWSDELLAELDAVGTAAHGPFEDADIDRSARGARRITADESFDFFGVGGFGLRVQFSSAARGSWVGYVIDAPDDQYQDMVILSALNNAGTGTRQLAAACSDLHKHFPPNGFRMSRTPWSADSTSEWAYWVRQAAVRGNSSGYSFEQIQASIWYITDRSGSYDSLPLLRAIGYPSNGPSKNTTSSPPSSTTPPTGGSSTNIGSTTSGCGAGLCGTGFFSAAPLTLAGVAMMKRAYRRGKKPD